MKRTAAVAVLFAVVGCERADQVCEDYITAANDCISQSGGTPYGATRIWDFNAYDGRSMEDAASYCKPYGKLKGDDAEEAIEVWP